MKSFAYILSPISIKQLKSFSPALKILPDFVIKASLKNSQPFKSLRYKNILSVQGQEVQGVLIVCPLLPRQMLESEESFVLDKIIAAGRVAQQLGAKIIGLGGYTAIVADKGLTVAKKLNMPVTTGKALTAWSIFEAIYRTARLKNIRLQDSSLTIVGGGSLGYLCAAKLSGYIPKITITDGNGKTDRLHQCKERILCVKQVEIIIEDNVHNAVKNADFIINASRSLQALFSLDELKAGAVVCDVSVPWNIADSRNNRHDITVIRAGLVKVPDGCDTIVHASLAETMLLTLEEKFTSYSLGDNINLDKLEEIADLAVRHGFEIWVPQAPLF